MALNTQLSTAAQNAAVNGITGTIGTSGFLDIYDGTQPANANTAVSTQNKLAHLPLSATAFAAASSGSATANTITSATALLSGTATWFRVTTSAGTGVWDGSVGTSGCNLNLNSATIQSGATVSVSSWTMTEPAAGA